MQFFRRRPLCVCGGLLMGASLSAFFFCGWLKLLIAVLAGLCLAGYALYVVISGRKYLRKRIPKAALLTLPILLGMLSSFFYFDLWYDGTFSRITVLAEEKGFVQVEAMVAERRGDGNYAASYCLRILTVEGESFSGKALLRTDGYSDWQAGDTLCLDATVKPLAEGCVNRTGLASLLSEGYLLYLEPIDPESVSKTEISTGNDLSELLRKLQDLREFLSVRLSESVGGEAGDVASALILGDRSRLSASTERNFRRMGISHLLALSGLHMGVLCLILDGILRLFRLGKRVRVLFLIAAILLYLALIGFLPSACRAGFMLIVLYAAYLFSGEYDAPTALFAVCGGMLLFSPATVADLSFWLSFSAVFGILALYPVLSEGISCLGNSRHRKRKHGQDTNRKTKHSFSKVLSQQLFWRPMRYLLCGISVGICALIPMSGVMCFFFDTFSLYSPIITLAVSPLIGLVLGLCVLFFSVGWIPVIGAFLADLLRVVLRGVLDLTSAGASVNGGWGVLSLQMPLVKWVVPAAVLATVILLSLRLKRKWSVFLPTFCAVLVLGIGYGVWFSHRGQTGEMTYLRLNQSSECLVLREGEAAYLFDLTDGYASRYSAAVRELYAGGATEWQAVVLTHYHTRHLSGMTYLLHSETVRNLCLPKPEDEEEYRIFAGLVRLAWSEGVTVLVYDNGEPMKMGNSTVSVYSAEVERSVQETFLISWTRGDHRAVYCGSAVEESQLLPMAWDIWSGADCVILGAHGPTISDQPRNLGNSLQTSGEILFTDAETYLQNCVSDTETNRLSGKALLLPVPGIYRISFPLDRHTGD